MESVKILLYQIYANNAKAVYQKMVTQKLAIGTYLNTDDTPSMSWDEVLNAVYLYFGASKRGKDWQLAQLLNIFNVPVLANGEYAQELTTRFQKNTLEQTLRNMLQLETTQGVQQGNSVGADVAKSDGANTNYTTITQLALFLGVSIVLVVGAFTIIKTIFKIFK